MRGQESETVGRNGARDLGGVGGGVSKDELRRLPLVAYIKKIIHGLLNNYKRFL